MRYANGLSFHINAPLFSKVNGTKIQIYFNAGACELHFLMLMRATFETRFLDGHEIRNQSKSTKKGQYNAPIGRFWPFLADFGHFRFARKTLTELLFQMECILDIFYMSSSPFGTILKSKIAQKRPKMVKTGYGQKRPIRKIVKSLA